MISFLIFETHGIIFEDEMTPDQARAIWKKLGATDQDLATIDSRKKFFRKKGMEWHPDRNPGNKKAEADFKALSAANDILKHVADAPARPTKQKPAEPPPPPADPDTDIVAGRGYKQPFTDFKSKPAEESGTPWQTDPTGYSEIKSENYTDINYFKKKMWEMSGKSKEKFSIYAFDGTSFQTKITVFGSEQIYEAMAKAMIIWNSYELNGNKKGRVHAVFVHKDDSDWDSMIALIYLDHDFSFSKKPEFLEYEGDNPAKDSYFVSSLPETLNDLSRTR